VSDEIQPPNGFAHTRFEAIRRRLEAFEPRPGWRYDLFEFLLFGFKQGWACLFGGLMLALLLATHLYYPDDAWLHRYDFITLGALAIQLAMLAFKLETFGEAKVIFAFHLVGTVMELFKTGVGSWSYPGEAILRIGDVPLFSGFMYAAVGSYLARIWRIFDLKFTHFPNHILAYALAVAIYLNFFAHHYLQDIRILLFALMGILFWPTWVSYRPWRRRRRMPLLFGWLLVALFIWFAENISTFARAWTYPDQADGWSMVSPMKLGAWYLLMYISFILVFALHGRKAGPTPDADD
jgi:uncharacterized membrane protein YoaT (DUF817 family)